VSMVDALLAVAASDRAAAVEAVAAAAVAAPGDRLPAALLRYLRADADGDVYRSPDALTRFIDGGSNRALYAALHTALRARYEQMAPGSLLDLGCGDGRVVVAVAGSGLRRIDLVEPSAALLDLAVAALAGGPAVVAGHAVTAAAFLAGLGADDHWDVVQSTFALHTLAAADRAAVLRALVARADRVLIAEFDVPSFDDRRDEHAAYAVDRYEQGLREYDGDEVVAQGFLMPVLVGQFDPGTVRHTHEQSAATWVDELRDAGFGTVTVHPLYPYWWADAVLLEATR